MNHFKNALLKTFCKILPVCKHLQTKARRILIVSTTALGDTLWATPSIASLRASFPDAYLAILTSPIGNEVLRTNPYIDRIHILSNPFFLWKTLYKETFDTILIFHTSQRLVLPLCSLLGASQIIGTTGINKGLDSLLTHPMPELSEHEIIRRLKIIEKIQGKITTETLSFFPDPQEPFPKLSSNNWIAIHPGSKDTFKRWPLEHFASVGKQLHPYNILITGNDAERPLMESLASQIPNSHLAPPNLSLHAFAHLLKQTKLIISNDTGPVHLACAINHPVIALYSATDPLLCGPHKAAKARAIFKPRTCFPCLKRKCLKRPFCLLQISPEEVVQTAHQFLK